MKNILLMLFVSVLWGCIEDNGNYDYIATRELKAMDVKRYYTLSEGESVTLTPKVVEKEDKEEKVIENVEFEWYIDHELVSNEASFTYTAKKNGFYAGTMKMKDPVSQAYSFTDFFITVSSKYESGFMILSEENGKSVLSMIRAKWLNSSDTVVYEGEWKDIYALENGGEILNGKPVSLSEHWAYEMSNYCIGEVTLMTEENGKMCVRELNGESLKRETYIEDEFANKELPTNFKPQKVIHTCFDSFILDGSGEIYSRRSTASGGYHTGYFSSKTKFWNGQKFEDIFFTQYDNTSAILAIEVDDEGKRNYVGIYSDNHRADYNLRRLTIGGDSDDLKDIQDEILWADWRANGNYYGCGMSVMMKNKAGDYILHYFDMEEASRTSWEVEFSDKINLTQTHGISKVIAMCTNKKMNYTYFCDDYNIYAIDNYYGDFYTVKSFDKKIINMADNSIIDKYDDCPVGLAVAFEDGSIEIWEVERNDATVFKGKVYESENNYGGNIKSIIFKVGENARFFDM